MTNRNSAPKLISIQVGMPTNYGSEGAADPHGQAWTTAFYKRPVQGRVFVRTTNIDGDRQADSKHHGGAHKAVLAYSADHYPEWRETLRLPDMPYGAFGENLTISGLSEESVCIGDAFRIGQATLEVSQPRQPCWKLARRWRMHDLAARVVDNGRSGWYLRVLEQGWIEPGMPVELIDRPNPDWSVARANQIMHHHRTDVALTLALAEVPKLSPAWVNELRERADQLRAAATLSGTAPA
jgi:MOSC domain-containing protein YiiM